MWRFNQLMQPPIIAGKYADLMTLNLEAEYFSLEVPTNTASILLPAKTGIYRIGSTRNSVDFTVGKGKSIVIPKGSTLKNISSPKSTNGASDYILMLSDELIPMTVMEYGIDKSILRECFNSKRLIVHTQWIELLIQRFLFSYLRCLKVESLASKFCLIELIKEIFYQTLGSELRTKEHRFELYDPMVRKALKIIEDDVSREFSVKQLASEVGCSQATLQRRFQKDLNSTPLAVIRKARLEKAYVMLLTGANSVGEVASKVGYSDLSAFTAAFKSFHEMLPSMVKQVNKPS